MDLKIFQCYLKMNKSLKIPFGVEYEAHKKLMINLESENIFIKMVKEKMKLRNIFMK